MTPGHLFDLIIGYGAAIVFGIGIVLFLAGLVISFFGIGDKD